MRTSRVTRASGFTLLEVMVAIVLTGLVVLLAYGAAQVGRAPAAQVTIRAPGVTRWDVRARLAGASGWLEEWPMTTVLPSAVAITMWHDSTLVGLPLQVRVVAGSALVPKGSIR